MTWAGTNISWGIPVNGRRVGEKLDTYSDESFWWGYYADRDDE